MTDRLRAWNLHCAAIGIIEIQKLRIKQKSSQALLYRGVDKLLGMQGRNALARCGAGTYHQTSMVDPQNRTPHDLRRSTPNESPVITSDYFMRSQRIPIATGHIDKYVSRATGCSSLIYTANHLSWSKVHSCTKSQDVAMSASSSAPVRIQCVVSILVNPNNRSMPQVRRKTRSIRIDPSIGIHIGRRKRSVPIAAIVV
jgi:hypothetical protein